MKLEVSTIFSLQSVNELAANSMKLMSDFTLMVAPPETDHSAVVF